MESYIQRKLVIQLSIGYSGKLNEATTAFCAHFFQLIYTVKVHCCVIELMSRQTLEHITAGESLNTRLFDPEIFISCVVSCCHN